MSSIDVVAVLTVLETAHVFVSLDGGWGVDALLGRQTRSHDDLDLAIIIDEVERVRAALKPHGYALYLDEMPTRFVLAAGGDRRIDLHPHYLDDTGFAHQRLPDGRVFTFRVSAFDWPGAIDGRRVRCFSPALQLAAHTGYKPDEKDRRDVEALCRRFDLALPPGYDLIEP